MATLTDKLERYLNFIISAKSATRNLSHAWITQIADIRTGLMFDSIYLNSTPVFWDTTSVQAPISEKGSTSGQV